MAPTSHDAEELPEAEEGAWKVRGGRRTWRGRKRDDADSGAHGGRSAQSCSMAPRASSSERPRASARKGRTSRSSPTSVMLSLSRWTLMTRWVRVGSALALFAPSEDMYRRSSRVVSRPAPSSLRDQCRLGTSSRSRGSPRRRRRRRRRRPIRRPRGARHRAEGAPGRPAATRRRSRRAWGARVTSRRRSPGREGARRFRALRAPSAKVRRPSPSVEEASGRRKFEKLPKCRFGSRG